jgi:hypothetical protein
MKRTRQASRMGRPAEFRHRVRLQVFLERDELVAVQRVADAANLSASRFARRVILAAVAKKED